jgi:IS4 transposase
MRPVLSNMVTRPPERVVFMSISATATRSPWKAAYAGRRRPWSQMTPLPEISVTVAFAREENPPSGQQPVEWILLTTRTVTTLAQARVIIGWYRCQWEIEVFFRTLNAVCRVERLQLTHADRLKPAIALYLIIAWRLLYLTKLARTRPDVPDSVVFEDQEWRLAYNDVKRQPPPRRTPSLREIIRLFRATWRVPGL